MTLYDLFKVPLNQVARVQATSATGNGVTDDTAAIQSDINALPDGGGLLFFPPGIYRVTAPLIINRSSVTLMGSGESTQFLADGDYGHVFDARPDVDPTVALAFTGIQFIGFFVNTRGNRTSGCVIHTKWTHSCTIRDMRIGTIQVNDPLPVYFYDGISLENESNAVISNCQINCRHYGVYFSGHKLAPTDYLGTNWWNGLITGNTAIWGDHSKNLAGSAGVYLAGNTGGVQIEQGGISHFENGVHVTGTSRELFLGHSFAADDIAGHGVLVDAGALLILQITGGWAAGCGRTIGGDGIHVSDQPGSELRTVIAGGTFYANIGNGIYVGAGTVIITGADANNNGGNDIELGAFVTAATITGTGMSVFKNDNSGMTPKLRGNLGVVDSG